MRIKPSARSGLLRDWSEAEAQDRERKLNELAAQDTARTAA